MTAFSRWPAAICAKGQCLQSLSPANTRSLRGCDACTVLRSGIASLGQFDFIYSLGLFDYLSDVAARRLLIYRSADQLCSLADRIAEKRSISRRTFLEPESNVAFLEVTGQ